MPTLNQLEYVIAVDENKNFSRAAKELNISQPSLSAQIQKVEHELDIIIFDRSQKPILTTQKGQDVIEQAKVILREHKKLYDIKNDSGELSGNFHLAVIPSLASNVLPLFVESFSSKYPKVNLRISEYKTEDMVKALYDDQLDGGLLVTPLYDDKIIERVLFYERFFVFASDNHKLAKRKMIKETDLDANSVWLLEEGHCFRDQVIKVCSLNRKHNVHENINFESGSLETLINLIRRGKGYTLLPELATMHLPQEELDHNVKKFHKPVPTREVSLVHSRTFLKQNILDALEEEIIANLPKHIKSLKREAIEIIDI